MISQVRLTDLVGQLTLAEKIALLHQHQPAIPRLGLEAFVTGTEALHGLAWLGPATVFPQAVGLASTWNPELVRAVGAAVGDETRAFHHKNPAQAGLNVWAPVVNPLRDPRWGRNEEGYAEDPLLTATMGIAYAGGLRGDHERYLRTAPTLKHFLAYNNETLRDQTSSNLPPRVLHEYELPVYRAPIAAGAAVAVMGSYNLVNGRPAHLSPLINDELRSWTEDEILLVSDAMAPSNVVNAQRYYPDHVASYAALLKAGVDSFTDGDADGSETVERITEALRRGLLDESDVDAAVRRIFAIRFRLGEFDPPERNPYAGVTEEAVNCPAHQTLAREAARQGIVLLKNSDRMLPLDADRAPRIAVIGPNGDSVYEDWYSGTLPYAVTVRAGHHRAPRRERRGDLRRGRRPDRAAARRRTPPTCSRSRATRVPSCSPPPRPSWRWRSSTSSTGGTASARCARWRTAATSPSPRPACWSAPPPSPTVGWSGRRSRSNRAATTSCCATWPPASTSPSAPTACVRADAAEDEATPFAVERAVSGLDQAVAAARAADVTVVVLGNHPLINGRETEDRADLELPPAQEELIRAVHAANPHTVLLVASSYPYAITWAEDHVPAILWSAHGGQEFGHAFAEVLFGDTAPAGRLTQTWYRSAADLPDLFDYDIIATDATYLYFRGAPLYPVRSRADLRGLRLLRRAALDRRGRGGRRTDGERRRAQHQRSRQRRGGAVLHPAAPVAGEAAAASAARLRAGPGAGRRADHGDLRAPRRRPGLLGRRRRAVRRRDGQPRRPDRPVQRGHPAHRRASTVRGEQLARRDCAPAVAGGQRRPVRRRAVRGRHQAGRRRGAGRRGRRLDPLRGHGLRGRRVQLCGRSVQHRTGWRHRAAAPGRPGGREDRRDAVGRRSG